MPNDEQVGDARLVRATVNLHGLKAGDWTWIDWPPTDYCARFLACSWLVLVDAPSPPSPVDSEDDTD